MEFQIVDRQMIINQLEAIKALESTIRNEVIEAQVSKPSRRDKLSWNEITNRVLERTK